MDEYDNLEKRKQEYIEHIEKHRENIKLVWNILKEEIKDKYSSKVLSQTNKNIKNHDKSKYNNNEFYGYRLKYYPTTEELDTISNKERDSIYMKAVITHKKINPHHLSYWRQSGRPRPMLSQFILEMVCDWTAGLLEKPDKTIRQVYSEICNKPIHKDTYNEIRYLVPVLDKILGELRNER